MDLLGDLGTADQLTSTRAENAVLQAKVKELTGQVKVLQVEKQALLAEVEIYRREAAASARSSNGTSSDAAGNAMIANEEDFFVKSGNGIYASDNAVTLPQPHGQANPLSCALHPDDTLLLTGAADSHMALMRWGAALSPQPDASEGVVSSASKVRCAAPVISAAFAQMGRGKTLPVVAGGCMDGSVAFANYSHNEGTLTKLQPVIPDSEKQGVKHGKYVKCVAWSPSAPLLATGSADGTVQLTKVVTSSANAGDVLFQDGTITLEAVMTLHLPGPVEALTFINDGDALCVYARGTPYLSYFDLKDGDYKQTKFSLNGGTTGGFDQHVSFAVMHLVPSPLTGNTFLAAATDTHRNIILETKSGKQVRNLYGHKNDGFSQPKISWSSNSQYLYGNTQEDGSVCIWDIASSSIVQRLDDSEKHHGHTGQIRDMCASASTETLVTASYDKTVKIWLQKV